MLCIFKNVFHIRYYAFKLKTATNQEINHLAGKTSSNLKQGKTKERYSKLKVGIWKEKRIWGGDFSVTFFQKSVHLKLLVYILNFVYFLF